MRKFCVSGTGLFHTRGLNKSPQQPWEGGITMPTLQMEKLRLGGYADSSVCPLRSRVLLGSAISGIGDLFFPRSLSLEVLVPHHSLHNSHFSFI